MPTTIDKKIVEMRFNNADFERNAAQSMRTVDKLKQSMKFDDSGDALSRIAKSVETLEARFSTLGIVGKRVIENITDSVINLERKFTGFVINGVKSGGIARAMNLENARFTMQGLLKDEAAVGKVMDAVSNSVDGTAYSLDQAATIAAQFVASGKQADEIEGALKGVAGAAAVTNSDFSSMGRIFAQVAGQGRLMGNDLLQLSTRGLNAAATMADFFNAINSGDESVAKVSDEVKTMVKDITAGATQTEATVRDLVSKSKVSFDIFAASMNNAFADQAAKANDTFTGSLSNIKAALGRIGADFVSPLIEQKGPLVKLFNTIREKVNDVKAVLTTDSKEGDYLSSAATFVKVVTNAIGKLEAKIKGLDIKRIIRPLYNIQFSIGNIAHAIGRVIRIGKDAFKDVFPKASVGKLITTLTGKLVKFTEKLTPSAKTADRLHRIFVGMFSIIRTGVDAVKAFIKIIGPDMASAFKTGLGMALNFAAKIADFFTKVSGWVHEGKTFERIFTTLHNVISGLTSVVKPVTGIFKAVFGTLGSLISKFFETFAKVDFKTAIIEMFGSIGTIIKNNWSRPFIFIKNELSKFGNFLDNWLSSLDIYKNIKAFLVKVKDTIVDSSVFQFILNAFTKLKDGIASIINSFRDVDTSGAKEMDEKLAGEFTWVDRIGTFLKKAGNVILTAGKFVWNAIKTVGTWVYDAIKNSGLGNAITNMINNSDLMDLGFGAAGGSLALVFWELHKIFKDGSKILDSVGAITSNFAKIMGDIHGTLEAFQKSLRADAIIKIAKAIAILAGSLFVLAIIPGDALAKGIVAITVLMENLSRIMTTFGKLSSSTSEVTDVKGGVAGFLKNLGNGALSIGGQMLLLATSIATLTIAVGVLGSMNADTLIQGLVIVTTLIEVLSKSVTKISKAGTNGPKAAATIAAMALAINMLIAPILLLGFVTTFSTDALAGVVVGVAVVSTLLSVIVLEVGGLIDAVTRYGKGFNTGKAKSAAIMMGLMAGMLELVTANVLVLALAASKLEINTGYVNGSIGGADKLLAAGGVIAGLLLVIMGVMAGLMEATKKFGSSEKVMTYRLAALSKIVKIAVATVAAITGLLVILEVATGEINVETKHLKTSVGGTGRLESGAKAVTMVLGGLLIFIGSMMKIIEKVNKAKVGKKGASISDDLKNVAIFIAAAAIAVGLIAAAITEMSKKVDIKKGWNAVLMITAVIGLITALAAISSLPFVAAGLNTLANTFVLFAVAAVGFAASIFIIVEAFSVLADASKEKINQIGDNMSALADQVVSVAPKWANAVAVLVASIIQTVVETIALGWKNIIMSVIDMLYQTFDALDGQVPMIVARLTALLVETVDALIPNLGVIVERIVALAIGLINALANAIDEHRSEILKAIGRLFNAIIKLVTEAVGRVLGKSGAELKEFMDTWGPRFKALGKLFAGIFITTKIFGGIKKMGLAIKTAYTATKTFVTGIKDGIWFFKTFRAEGSSTFEALKLTAESADKQGIASFLGGAKAVAAFVGAHGPLILALTAATVAVMSFVSAVENMSTVGEATESAERAAEAYADAYAKGAEKVRDKFKDVFGGTDDIRYDLFHDDPSADVQKYITNLEKLMTADGKVKQGMEEEAQTIVDSLNSILGTNITVEDGIVLSNGKKVDSYKSLESEIDNYLKKLKAQRTYEAYSAKAADWDKALREAQEGRKTSKEKLDKLTGKWDLEAMQASADDLETMFDRIANGSLDTMAKVESAGLMDNIIDAVKNANMVDKSQLKLLEAAIASGDFDDTMDPDTFVRNLTKEGDGINEVYNVLMNKHEEISGKVGKLQGEIDEYGNAISRLDTNLTNYEDLEKAIANGQYDRLEEITTKLEFEMQSRTNATEKELNKQFEAAQKNADDLEALSKDSTARITNREIEEAQKRIQIAYDEWAEKAKLEGISEKELKARKQATTDEIKELENLKTVSESFLDSLANGAKTKIGDIEGFDLSSFTKKFNLDPSAITDSMSLDKVASMAGIKAESIGDYVTSGFDNSIKSNASATKKTMESYTDLSVIKPTEDGLGIQSPSKVFENIGRYVVLGFAKGINGSSMISALAASKMAQMSIAAVKSALANQGKVSVKPIVDLSAIQNGSIQGMLNGRSLALNSNVSSQIAASINSTQFEAQMDKLSDQLRAMHSDMITIGNNNTKGLNNLGRTINGMQVVMNTGALVGQIAAPIDSAIGGIAAIKKRG